MKILPGIVSAKGVSASGPAIHTEAVYFDGTNDEFVSPDADKPADTYQLTMSFFFKINENRDNYNPKMIQLWGSASWVSPWSSSGADFRWEFYSSNGRIGRFKVAHSNTDQTWTHFIASIDTQNDLWHCYRNDIDNSGVRNKATPPLDPVEFSRATSDAYFGKIGDGTPYELCSVYVNNVYFDLSIESNRRKFVNADGTPVDLGSDGSGPTGSQPLVYIAGDAAAWNNASAQRGSITGISMTGSVEDSSNEPVDAF